MTVDNSLTLRNLGTDDQDVYVCTATNIYGSAADNCDLRVEGAEA